MKVSQPFLFGTQRKNACLNPGLGSTSFPSDIPKENEYKIIVYENRKLLF